MSEKSTAYRLFIYISTAVATVFIVLIVLFYNFSRELLRENVEKNAITLSTGIISKIRGNVVFAREVAANVATQFPYYAQNGDVGLFLGEILKKYPFIRDLHIYLAGSPSGDGGQHFSAKNAGGKILIEADNRFNGFDSVRQKFWGEGEADTAGWSEPYRQLPDSTVIAAYYNPVWGKNEKGVNELSGIVVSEFSLTELDIAVRKISQAGSGYAFLVSPQGTYITHPLKKNILSANLKNLSDTIYRGERSRLAEIFSSSKSGNLVAYPPVLNYKRSWVYYTVIPENNWRLIFVKPFSELYKDLHYMLAWMVGISILGLILVFFLIKYISKKLMDPLSRLASEVHGFSSQGKIQPSKNEFDTLLTGFNKIQVQYNKYKSDYEKAQVTDKKFRHELELASEIQRSIIPTSFPAFPGREEVDIYSTFKPAFIVSGDLYDYFLVDNNHLLVTIGDVSGKGISAAMFMGVAHTLIRSNASSMIPKVIVSLLNNELCKKNQNQFFLTLFLGIFDLDTGILNYCNAAHTTSFILSGNGDINELNEAHGLPLGLYPEKTFRDSTVRLSENDILILYTDGITETMDSDGFLLGETRFKENIGRFAGANPNEIITKIEKSLTIFRDGAPLTDDLSMVVLKYRPSLRKP